MQYWRLFMDWLRGFFADKYEVRGKLVTGFIDEVLMPRIREGKGVSLSDLILMVAHFKEQFTMRYDATLIEDFEIVPSVELELLCRHAREPESEELLRAVIAIGTLVDRYPELIRV